MQILLKLVAALAAAIALVPALAAEPPTFRLPAGARPTHYAVTLTVVPGEAKATGEITIDIELDRAHDVLWLNADSITVTRPRTELADTRATILSGFEQFVGVSFEPPLAAGRHRLTLAFEAEQARNSTR